MLGINTDETKSVENIIGKKTKLEGEMDTDNSIRIDGEFEGTIHCRETLVIGAGADIDADITTNKAIIGGRVNGTITAHEKIEIHTTGEIYGDLTAPVLKIEKGVVLEGSCTINTGEEDTEKVTSIKNQLG